MQLVKLINGCNTGQIEGLSQQLIYRLLEKKILVKINHPLINCTGRQNNPYLQPIAYKQLIKAVEARNQTLFINSCLRTVMQQYMLRRQYELNICGIRAAARPPHSNHQSGMAIDIQDSQGWKPYLARFQWTWIGSFDPMHFDFQGGGVNLNKLQVLEFQRLWNRHNPYDRLRVDGIWGEKTANKVEQCPAQGFGNPQVLKQGDFCREVGEIQILLRQALNLSAEELKADFHFGSATHKAVMLFQQKHGLTVDGVVGQLTMEKLRLE